MDPATLQVWISRLAGVADEMGAVLRRAAYSPNIKERADCSCALFAPDGTLLAQAEHIPVHLGSMPAAVRAAIDACGDRRRARRPDRRQRSVRGRHAPQRHHVRRARASPTTGRCSGGPRTARTTPTSAGWRPARCRPTRPRSSRRACASRPSAGRRRSRRSSSPSSRTPDERRGDLDAQLGANRLGVARLRELVAIAPDVLDRDRRLRRAPHAGRDPRALPDGEYSLRGRARLDRRPRRRANPARICVDGHRARRRDHVRLRRDRRAAGRIGERGRSRDGQRGRVRAAVGRRSRSPGERRRAAAGARARAGGLDRRGPDARRGRRRQRRGEPARRRRVPRRARAGRAGARRRRVAGDDEQRARSAATGWVYYETIGGGQGGRPDGRAGNERRAHRDDQHARHAGRGVRARVPDAGAALRVAARTVAAPASRAGGDGIVRELEMLEDATVSLITERRVVAPVGHRGRRAGRGRRELVAARRRRDASRAGSPTSAPCGCDAGDVVRILTPGGGGFGSAAPSR